MARFVTRYNEFGQQYLALPLSISYSGVAQVVVKKIYVENIFYSNSPGNTNRYAFQIALNGSDYSNVNVGASADYDIYYSTSSPSDALNGNFQVGNEFVLPPGEEFTFEVLFDPNINKDSIALGEFNCKLHIIYDENSTPKSPIIKEMTGMTSLKEIVSVDGVSYQNILSVFGVNRNNINILG